MATSHALALLLLCTIILSISQFSLSERCNPSDKKVLFQIKKALNNPDVLSSWIEGTDCCDWSGPLCDDKTNRINSLSIYDANISGSIPAAIGNLPYLESLVIYNSTNLTGPIHPAIAKLTHLTSLWLTHNSLSGPIPSFIGDLKNISYLNLANNQLTGTIPPSLSKLTKLYGINLEGNKLNGQLPTWFSKIRFLYLARNQFTGPIPESFGKLSHVEILDISRNKFAGDASHIFQSRSTDFFLSRNAFEFDLTNIVFSKGISILYLDHNKIYGSLPEGLKDIELLGFNVRHNRLCGKIPTSGSLLRFGPKAFSHNKCLCGAPLQLC